MQLFVFLLPSALVLLVVVFALASWCQYNIIHTPFRLGSTTYKLMYTGLLLPYATHAYRLLHDTIAADMAATESGGFDGEYGTG